jgi:hypothetical protein
MIVEATRPAGRRGAIKALLMREQVNALGLKLAEEAEQIDERPAKAIDRLTLLKAWPVPR